VSATFKVSLWASQVGLAACLILLITSIDCFYYPGGIPNGAFAIVTAVVLGSLFWPLKLGCFLILVRNFWLATFTCWAFSIYLYFLTPTIIGGIILDLTGVMYLIAAFRGEMNRSEVKGRG